MEDDDVKCNDAEDDDCYFCRTLNPITNHIQKIPHQVRGERSVHTRIRILGVPLVSYLFVRVPTFFSSDQAGAFSPSTRTDSALSWAPRAHSAQTHTYANLLERLYALAFVFLLIVLLLGRNSTCACPCVSVRMHARISVHIFPP